MSDHIGYDLVVNGNRVHFAISFGVAQEHGCHLRVLNLQPSEVAGFQRIHQNGINAGMSVVDAYHWAYDGWTSEWGPRAPERRAAMALQVALQNARPLTRSEETALVLWREVESGGRAREEAAKVACWLLGAVIALLASGVL